MQWLWRIARGHFHYDAGNSNAAVPFWFLVAVAAALSIAPWLRFRFSLRTLLIAMTLFAVVLGLIVWPRR
jgi:hypothetical protein